MSKLNKDTVAYKNKLAYISKWSRKNLKQYCLSLNKNTDKEIIAFLDTKESATGYIRELLKKELGL